MTKPGQVTLLPGLDVSRETEQALRDLVELVQKWTRRINLVSRHSMADIWNRHVLDSAQLIRLVPEMVSHWVDLGSGGGFPGLVLGILARENHRIAQLTLVESDQRKATFLRAAGHELGIPLRVVTSRIEVTPPLAASILSARALGPLKDLLQHASRHLDKNGTALFLKGKSAESEIIAARTDWEFDLATTPSLTDPGAQILQIKDIAHV